MKQFIFTLSILTLLASPITASAHGGSHSTDTTPEEMRASREQVLQKVGTENNESKSTSENSTNKLTSLQSKAQKEIDRRIASLQRLSLRLEKMKHLQSDTVTSLKDDITSQITSLTTLKGTLNGTVELKDLRPLVSSIKESYRIYAIYMPKIHILATADSLEEVAAKLTEMKASLEVKIAAAKANGKDTGQLQTYLLEMNSNLETSLKQADTATNLVINLKPEDFPAKDTLKSARVALKEGRNGLKLARNRAQLIINSLKEQSTTQPTSSATSETN